MPTHVLATRVPLTGSQKLFAQYALETPRDAVVFVHGFWGSAVGTWPEFQQTVQEVTEPSFRRADFFYFEYRWLRDHANFSGGKLELALQKIMTRPLAVMKSTLETTLNRPKKFQYRRLIIVAHSLGAMVSRFALIAADGNSSPWCNRTTLALFAPAHLGANLQRLLIEEVAPLHTYLRIAGTVAQFVGPSIQDLSPKGTTVSELRDQTLRLLGKKTKSCHIAKAVVQAQKEWVVVPGTFVKDPPPILADGRGQMNVKNFSPQYVLPLQILRDILNAA